MHEPCYYCVVFKTRMWYCCAFTWNFSNLCLWHGFETKTKLIRERRISATPNSRSPITILKCSERNEENRYKSNAKTDKRERENASRRTANMMKITMSSTQKTNEPWRRVRRMRSIIECYFDKTKPRHVMLVVKGRRWEWISSKLSYILSFQ